MNKYLNQKYTSPEVYELVYGVYELVQQYTSPEVYELAQEYMNQFREYMKEYLNQKYTSPEVYELVYGVYELVQQYTSPEVYELAQDYMCIETSANRQKNMLFVTFVLILDKNYKSSDVLCSTLRISYY